jgi:circadian clock protein KaiC
MAVSGISIIMTTEIHDLFATSYLSEFGISHMSDNVILLNYLREESEVKRAITILKTRASRHDTMIRQFYITPDGIKIGDVFSSKTALTGG